MAKDNFKTFIATRIEQETGSSIENLPVSVRVEAMIDFIYNPEYISVLKLLSKDGLEKLTLHIAGLMSATIMLDSDSCSFTSLMNQIEINLKEHYSAKKYEKIIEGNAIYFHELNEMNKNYHQNSMKFR